MLETLEMLRLRLEESTPTYGRLALEPLDRGYGDTLGNALRRVLLSSIGGAAITAVRFDGVLHEFSTIPGVREDVIEILMNLKHIPIRSASKDIRVISVDVEKEGVLTVGDLPEDPDVEFVDPEAKICTMEKGSRLTMDLHVEQGTEYLSMERPRPSHLPLDALLTDAIFSPVRRVNYHVEAARVGQRTDYERLALDVWTDGSLSPDMALTEACQVLQSYFGHILARLDRSVEGLLGPHDPDIPLDLRMSMVNEEMLAKPVRELELSIRSENCLLRGGIQTIGELLQKSREDLLKIRNLGKISLSEIEEKLVASGMKLRDKKDRASKEKEDKAS